MLVTAIAAELKRKVSSFRIARFDRLLFFFFFFFLPVFHHKDAENVLPSFMSDVP